ncbi:MAG TPA: carbohydrate ABC transporter permease [Gaiellaceae bacterium]|nr:carbohydrate ABC transporter permease [Gaiellaceae bacterium]
MPPHPLARAARLITAAAVALTFLLPLVFLVSGSLRKPGLPPPRTPELVPDPVVGSNYGEAVDLVGLGRATLNSLLVCALTVPPAVLVASLAGFALAQLPGRVARPLVAVSFAAMMVPLTALLVPRFVLFRSLGLVDTWAPLVAPALLGGSPFYVLIFYASFRRLPRELVEAARLEGLSPLATWRRVAMPLVRPVTAAVAVLAFVATWSDFLNPLIFLFDRDRYTVPLALKSLGQLDPANAPLLLAGAVLATAPVVVAFLSAQRWFLGEHRGPGWLGR